MSKLKKITVHNNERAADPRGIIYTLTISSLERRIEWCDRLGNLMAERILECEGFDRLLGEIKQWMLGVGPDDVTYYGRFKTPEEHSAWCSDLLCEDHEVNWDVLCEFTDGSCTAYVCADSTPFPKPFGEMALQTPIGKLTS